ncbi:hypothetical protein NP233_g7929 [Leucocoprinus birnbaumii]|uniref:Uncharacterized protein n=1 Tax=Leucocoprinus birnbaumii TaxID=56174 RepID=A0AAD5YUA7_9AGAR|nr:hypothetical protein NP233_g7929 [Leucocoprinus birnbaumii]
MSQNPPRGACSVPGCGAENGPCGEFLEGRALQNGILQRVPDSAEAECGCGHLYHSHVVAPEFYRDGPLGPKGGCSASQCYRFLLAVQQTPPHLSLCVCRRTWVTHGPAEIITHGLMAAVIPPLLPPTFEAAQSPLQPPSSPFDTVTGRTDGLPTDITSRRTTKIKVNAKHGIVFPSMEDITHYLEAAHEHDLVVSIQLSADLEQDELACEITRQLLKHICHISFTLKDKFAHIPLNQRGFYEQPWVIQGCKNGNNGNELRFREPPVLMVEQFNMKMLRQLWPWGSPDKRGNGGQLVWLAPRFGALHLRNHHTSCLTHKVLCDARLWSPPFLESPCDDICPQKNTNMHEARSHPNDSEDEVQVVETASTRPGRRQVPQDAPNPRPSQRRRISSPSPADEIVIGSSDEEPVVSPVLNTRSSRQSGHGDSSFITTFNPSLDLFNPSNDSNTSSDDEADVLPSFNIATSLQYYDWREHADKLVPKDPSRIAINFSLLDEEDIHTADFGDAVVIWADQEAQAAGALFHLLMHIHLKSLVPSPPETPELEGVRYCNWNATFAALLHRGNLFIKVGPSSTGRGVDRTVLYQAILYMISFEENSRWGTSSDTGVFNPLFGAGTFNFNDQAYWHACGSLVAMMAYHVGVIPTVSPWVTMAVVAGTRLPEIGLSGVRALDPASANILKLWYKIKPTTNVTEQHTQKLLHVFAAAGAQTFREYETVLNQGSPMGLVAYMSGRDLDDPHQVISHIKCTLHAAISAPASTVATSSDPPPNTFTARFTELVKDYLKGEGHPSGHNALLSDPLEFKNPRVFRSLALLEAATGLPLRPASEFWEIEFRLYEPENLSPTQAEILKNGFNYHTCFSAVDVLLSDELKAMLVSEDIDVVNAFSSWIHPRILASRKGLQFAVMELTDDGINGIKALGSALVK